jgi:hypothetical protein
MKQLQLYTDLCWVARSLAVDAKSIALDRQFVYAYMTSRATLTLPISI